MTDVYLLEPEPSTAWFPFLDSRPIAEMRAGVWLIRERWEAVARGETLAILGPAHLTGFVEDGVPQVIPVGPVDGPAVIGRSAFAPSGVPLELPNAPARLVNDGETVGWWVPAGGRWEPGTSVADQDEVGIDGVLLHGAYDLLTALEHLLPPDTADFTHEPGDELPEGSVLIGDPTDVVLLGAHVEPGVVFDVRAGAVVVEQHAYVRGGTRLEGPLYVGPGSEVLGGPLARCIIGPRCKVRGEMQATVMIGYANKAHDGFVGHSVIGRWVNIGAGSTTSNLKNTYGAIRLTIEGDRIETERQYLGTLFGDHAKVAIGTFFDTGSVVGVGANVFGPARPPKYVPPFAWGFDGERVSRDGFVAIAERVMTRRQVEVSGEVKAGLERLYDYATTR
jgi:UDP-N-acetylglucosamine diphosphorylase/glucosamine-1-phosphate N-acetyltransferase